MESKKEEMMTFVIVKFPKEMKVYKLKMGYIFSKDAFKLLIKQMVLTFTHLQLLEFWGRNS